MTIKEVSEKYHISEATLRYYEKEGVILPIERKNGVRNYTKDNFSNIEFVICMRNAGMSMERLKQYMTLFHVPNSEIKRKQILEEQRREIIDKMVELQKSLDKLNYKIEHYEQVILNKI